MYKVHLLPATFGDSILIEYGTSRDPKYILIDGGPYYVFDELWAAIKQVAPDIRELELLVVTHIDIDHIDGVIKLLNAQGLPFGVKEIWFNGREQLGMAAEILDPSDLGSLQGEFLTMLIKQNSYAHNTTHFKGGPVCVRDYNELPEIILDGGMKITLLSPGIKDLVDLIPVWDQELKDRDPAEEWGEETRYEATLSSHIEQLQEMEFKADKSEANCSSIAFIATYNYMTCLFAADAPSHKLLAAIEPMLDKSGNQRLEIDAWKLAHHGSKKSTQDSIMSKIHSRHILVSSDGKRYKHPDEAVIAKLLRHNVRDMVFHFNYQTEFNDMWDNEDLKAEYNYSTIYPKIVDSPGITVELTN